MATCEVLAYSITPLRVASAASRALTSSHRRRAAPRLFGVAPAARRRRGRALGPTRTRTRRPRRSPRTGTRASRRARASKAPVSSRKPPRDWSTKARKQTKTKTRLFASFRAPHRLFSSKPSFVLRRGTAPAPATPPPGSETGWPRARPRQPGTRRGSPPPRGRRATRTRPSPATLSRSLSRFRLTDSFGQIAARDVEGRREARLGLAVVVVARVRSRVPAPLQDAQRPRCRLGGGGPRLRAPVAVRHEPEQRPPTPRGRDCFRDCFLRELFFLFREPPRVPFVGTSRVARHRATIAAAASGDARRSGASVSDDDAFESRTENNASHTSPRRCRGGVRVDGGGDAAAAARGLRVAPLRRAPPAPAPPPEAARRALPSRPRSRPATGR